VPVEIDPQELLQKAVDTFNGSQRLGQQQMVATIVEGLIAGGHRIIQAGTGTGSRSAIWFLLPPTH